jgi:gamma-glutamyltranspeptidase/glutathione hydrolase
MLKKNYTAIILMAVFWGTRVYADGHKVAIASAHPLAMAAGFEILDKGGNVFDAALAVSAALAVVEPSGSGLGDGGYWLLHREKNGLETPKPVGFYPESGYLIIQAYRDNLAQNTC